MECKYCKRVLKTKSSLNNHQKTTKYCLKIQGKDIKRCFECKYCSKNFIKKGHLTDHFKVCKNDPLILKKLLQRKDVEIELLKKELEIYKKDKDKLLKDLVNRPTTTNKNTINQTLNLTVFNKTAADIKKLVEEKYDTNYLLQGQKGVARFTHSHVLEGNKIDDKDPIYIITDRNRGNGKYKSSRGEIVSDNGLQGLTKKVYPSVKDKACRLALKEKAMENEDIYNNFQDVFGMMDDNTDFRKEMVKLIN